MQGKSVYAAFLLVFLLAVLALVLGLGLGLGLKKKDDTLDAIKESGLGLMKAVKVAKKKKGGKDEL